jgi:hypothetical protein
VIERKFLDFVLEDKDTFKGEARNVIKVEFYGR